MSTLSKSFLILTLSLLTVIGAAGIADARGGTCCGDVTGATPCSKPDAAPAISPEVQKILQPAQEKLAPLALELRAKHKEFTARIYSEADSKVTEALSKDILRLQAQVTEARLALQQQLAAAGVPLRESHGMLSGMKGGMKGGGGMKRGKGSCPMWR